MNITITTVERRNHTKWHIFCRLPDDFSLRAMMCWKIIRMSFISTVQTYKLNYYSKLITRNFFALIFLRFGCCSFGWLVAHIVSVAFTNLISFFSGVYMNLMLIRSCTYHLVDFVCSSERMR